jgi:Protein of unknown function (DUF2637)
MNAARHDTTAAAPAGVDEARSQRRRLARVRYAVRGVLFLGVAASLAANMLHAEPNNYSRTIAAWPPLALFATIEVISRVPVSRAWLAGARVVSTIVIGGIAAWVSYWHMVAVVGRFGEQGATPYLLPFSVDGLVIVASVSLLELADRIHHLQEPHTALAHPGSKTAVAQAQISDSQVRHNVPAANGSSAPGGERPHRERATASGDTDEGAPSGSSDMASLISDLRRRRPGLDVATIATQVGRSKRTVQRILKTLDEQQQQQPSVNGAKAPELLPAGQRR